MPTLTEYLIKLTLGLSVMSLFYQLVLSRYTFYNWNRWYLLLYSVLAFVIPLINISPVLEQNAGLENELVASIPAVQDFVPVRSVALPVANAPEIQDSVSVFEFGSWDQIFLGLFFAGMLVMMGRLVLSWACYLHVKRNADLVFDEEVKIYHLHKEIAPFSFGNGVFFNPALHNDQDQGGIMLHELVHVRQKHSIDIVWAEILCTVNWFNPFAWMIRHAIRQNHEYIADRAVLEYGFDAKQYQYLLLKVVGVPELLIGNQFNISSLKNRIIMMNKSRTGRVYLASFLFVLPVLALSIIMFRDKLQTVVQAQENEEIFEFLNPEMTKPLHLTGIILDAETGKPVAGLPLRIDINERFSRVITTDVNGFYCEKVNPADTIRSVSLTYEEGVYKPFGSAMDSRREFGDAQIVFAVKNAPSDLITGSFWEDLSALEGLPITRVRENALQILQQSVQKHIEVYNLIAAFRTKYHWTNYEITKFGGAYFDRKRNLIGYVDQLKFYLDGKESTYEQINDAFEYFPVEMLNVDQIHVNSSLTIKLASRMYFYSFKTSKEAPPQQYISPENMVASNVQNFDLSLLEKDAYMLDGFRQTEGVGSNLKPLKEEIKRIYLFKGSLARYYDRKLDKIWWIETRPVEEVYGRPDLAAN